MTIVSAATIVVLAVLALALMVVAVAAGVRHLLKRAPTVTAAGVEDPPPKLATTIGVALRELRDMTRARDDPQDVPWVLAVGVAAAQLEPLLPPPAREAGDRPRIGWLDRDRLTKEGTLSFRDHGVVLGFEDGLVENPLWEPKLRGLLKALDRVRPLRPIDALAVVAPASLLVAAADPAAPGALDAAKAIAERGQRLYEILLTVQKRTGWRLPIHVLISGCDDAVPGFEEWTRLAQADQGAGASGQAPLVGWPAPFGIDTAYRAEWVDLALEAMSETLTQQQFPLMMRPGATESATPLFLLPERLGLLRPGIATLLERMLQGSAYHEAFMLRGIYLTDGGEPPAPPASSPPAAAAAEPPAPAGDAPSDAAAKVPPIARRVFDTRVFVERGLAQPAHGEMTRRHHMVRRAQWALAAVVAAAALGIAGVVHFVVNHIPPIDALLAGVSAHVRDAARVYPVQATRAPAGVGPAAETMADGSPAAGDAGRSGGVSWPAGRCGTAAADRPLMAGARTPDRTVLRNSQDLLALLARVDSNGVDTVWAPSSALDPLNGRVKASVDIGYRVTICNALLYKMASLEGINALLVPYQLDMPDDERWLNVVENAGKFDHAYRELDKIRDHQLGSRQTVASFRDAAGFALGFDLPKTFNADYGIYGRGIADSSVPHFDEAGVRELFQTALKARFLAALEAHYPCRPLAIAVQRIARRFEIDPHDGVAALEPAQSYREGAGARCPALDAAGAPPEPEAILRQFLDDYAAIAARGAIPGRYEWVYMPDRDARAPGNQLAAIERLTLVSDGFAKDLARRSLDTSHDTAQALRAATLAGAPMLIAVDGRPQPSPALTAIRAYVEELFAQPFMAVVAKGDAVLPDGRIEWNLERLQEAGRATEAFLNFSVPAVAAIPRPVQDLVRPAATQHFVAYARATLSTAARPAPAGDGAADEAEVAAFAQALPFLVNLRNSLRQAQAPEAMHLANQLDDRVSGQAERLLFNAERRLRARNVYALDQGGLQTWSGSDALAPQAFGVASADDLKAELAERRAIVGALARGGAVVAIVAYLRDPGTLAESRDAAALAARWDDLRLTLQAYEANRPGNALARLEEFVTTELDLVRLPACRLRDTAPGAGSYFADQIRAIRAQVLVRCGGGMEARYAALAERFNRDLAQRFPFSDPTESRSADPDQVRDFFLTYGEELPAFRAALAAATKTAGAVPDRARAYGESGRAAVRFVDRLIEAQRALAPMLGAGKAETPLTYRVGVAFFTDPSLAVAQSQVIEAMIGASPSRAASGGNPSFVWTNGQPIDVTLRWAANAPTQPQARPSQRWPRVDGATAQYRVEGDWALLRLIRAAAPTAAEAGAIAPRGASPIAFTVPLSPNLQKPAVGGDSPGLSEARVFLRLTIRAAAPPDQAAPQTISLPPFPTVAPALRRGDMAARFAEPDGAGS